MMQQQQTAPYEIDPRIPNYQSFEYTLIQPQSSVFNDLSIESFSFSI